MPRQQSPVLIKGDTRHYSMISAYGKDYYVFFDGYFAQMRFIKYETAFRPIFFFKLNRRYPMDSDFAFKVMKRLYRLKKVKRKLTLKTNH